MMLTANCCLISSPTGEAIFASSFVWNYQLVFLVVLCWRWLHISGGYQDLFDKAFQHSLGALAFICVNDDP